MKRIYNGVTVEYQNETDCVKSNVIYLLTFPNGKVYIGQTTQKVQKRIQNHCLKSSGCRKLHNAILKYKIFNIQILSSGLTLEQLNVYECFFITAFDSVNTGYNLESGGKTRKSSDETKKKISESQKGRTLSMEHKKKISESIKGHITSKETKLKISKALKGKIMSAESKLKMSETNKGKIVSDETKLKISMAEGVPFFDDFNNHFRSTRNAAEYYKCGHTTISNLLKSGKKSKKLGTGFHY